jgi:hypothetical protein
MRLSLAAATPEKHQPVRLQSEDPFALCLDNARRCFLVLKFVFLPLLCLFGIFAASLYTMWFLGYIKQFSCLFFLHTCATALISGAPVVLIPFIVRLRLPVSVRLAAANTLFVAVCLLVPFLNAHFIWHRHYRELSGFVLVPEFFFGTPSLATAAAGQSRDTLSICDDTYFFVLFVLDHSLLSVSRFILPTMIELPTRYFSFTVVVHTVVLWASAFHISNVYISACGDHPKSAANAEIAKLYLPLGHMIHLATFLVYLFTSLFVSSRNREQNKKLVRSLLAEAVSTTRVHLEAIFLSNRECKPKQTGTFWSRTEFLTLKQEKPPLLLPAGVGVAYKVSSGLKDFGLYVWALSVIIYFIFFELMRVVVAVHLPPLTTITLFCIKCLSCAGRPPHPPHRVHQLLEVRRAARMFQRATFRVGQGGSGRYRPPAPARHAVLHRHHHYVRRVYSARDDWVCLEQGLSFFALLHPQPYSSSYHLKGHQSLRILNVHRCRVRALAQVRSVPPPTLFSESF